MTDLVSRRASALDLAAMTSAAIAAGFQVHRITISEAAEYDRAGAGINAKLSALQKARARGRRRTRSTATVRSVTAKVATEDPASRPNHFARENWSRPLSEADRS